MADIAVEVDCTTGEVITRALTDAEQADLDATRASAAAAEEQRRAKVAAALAADPNLANLLDALGIAIPD